MSMGSRLELDDERSVAVSRLLSSTRRKEKPFDGETVHVLHLDVDVVPTLKQVAQLRVMLGSDPFVDAHAIRVTGRPTNPLLEGLVCLPMLRVLDLSGIDGALPDLGNSALRWRTATLDALHVRPFGEGRRLVPYFDTVGAENAVGRLFVYGEPDWLDAMTIRSIISKQSSVEVHVFVNVSADHLIPFTGKTRTHHAKQLARTWVLGLADNTVAIMVAAFCKPEHTAQVRALHERLLEVSQLPSKGMRVRQTREYTVGGHYSPPDADADAAAADDEVDRALDSLVCAFSGVMSGVGPTPDLRLTEEVVPIPATGRIPAPVVRVTVPERDIDVPDAKESDDAREYARTAPPPVAEAAAAPAPTPCTNVTPVRDSRVITASSSASSLPSPPTAAAAPLGPAAAPRPPLLTTGSRSNMSSLLRLFFPSSSSSSSLPSPSSPAKPYRTPTAATAVDDDDDL